MAVSSSSLNVEAFTPRAGGAGHGAGRARADYLACYHMNVAGAARRERFLREVAAEMRALVPR